MCGIVGAIRTHHNVVDFLTDGLKRLEYRGYDSSGIAVQTETGIRRVRRVGRVALMEEAAKNKEIYGHTGIGHTRWATHGGVTEPNAHPHISAGLISVVHNGIIENFEAERSRLEALDYVFESQTDTEVIAHSVHHEYEANGGDLYRAVQTAPLAFMGLMPSLSSPMTSQIKWLSRAWAVHCWWLLVMKKCSSPQMSQR